MAELNLHSTEVRGSGGSGWGLQQIWRQRTSTAFLVVETDFLLSARSRWAKATGIFPWCDVSLSRPRANSFALQSTHRCLEMEEEYKLIPSDQTQLLMKHTYTHMCFLLLGLPSHLGGFRLPPESFNPPHPQVRLQQRQKHTALSATFLPSAYQQTPSHLCLTSKVCWISCFSSSFSY